MIKLFVGSTYEVRHENINKNNCLKMLRDDIRSKLIGNTKNFVYGSENIILKNNKNIEYVGGFYYEQKPNNFTSQNECDYIVEAELRQIEKADLIVIILNNYSAIATITELIYASFKNKKIIIFCNPNITSFKVESEYWFPIIVANKINHQNIKIIFTDNNDEIINYINNIKEE